MALNERELYYNILRRDRSIVQDALSRFKGSAGAQEAASAFETEKLLGATGAPAEIAAAVRGTMTEEAAAEISDAEAVAKSQILKDLQGPERLAEVEKEAAEQVESIKKDIHEEETGGQAIATGSGIVGATLGTVGTALSSSGVGSLVGLPLILAGGLTSLIGGGAGAGIAEGAASAERIKAMKDIRTQASEFEAPSLAGYEQMLSSRPNYGGINTQWLGGQSARRPRYLSTEEILDPLAGFQI
jgi:hypothetical protein